MTQSAPHIAQHHDRWQLPSDVRAAIDALPRACVLTWSTPTEPLARLREELGGPERLVVKRDDLTGMGLGGNKVRKLEYYFGKARANGCDTVLITGAVQSNYVRIAAAFAARFGLDCHVQLENRVAGMADVYHDNGNVLLDDLLGATRWQFAMGEDETAADAEVEKRARDLTDQGHRPFVIPLSPGNPPLGAVGYVRAAVEILSQEPEMSDLVVASGSGLTHSGLLFGLKAMGWPGRLHGICVRRGAAVQQPRIAGHCARLAQLLGVANPVVDDDILVDDSMLAPGYGSLNADTSAAMRLLAELEGLILDPVYTARTFAGAIRRIKSGTISAPSRVVIIHTGGIPALFSYEPQIRETVLSRSAPSKSTPTA